MYSSRPSNPYHSLIKRTGTPFYMQSIEDLPEIVEEKIEEKEYEKLLEAHKNETKYLWIILALVVVLFLLFLFF